jgi:DNA-binding beta-propeller fold protein YncE
VPVAAARPVDLVAAGGKLYLLNEAPVGTGGYVGEVVVLDATLRTVGTVRLTGAMSQAMVARGPSLYVLNGGLPGTVSGSVSVMDTASLRESAVLPGFGESPGSMAFSSSGELYVAVPATGLLIYSTITRTFLRGPGSPLTADGMASVWRVAPDPAGFVYALQTGACDRPGTLVRLDANGATMASARTGVCPWDVAFATLTAR